MSHDFDFQALPPQLKTASWDAFHALERFSIALQEVDLPKHGDIVSLVTSGHEVTIRRWNDKPPSELPDVTPGIAPVDP